MIRSNTTLFSGIFSIFMLKKVKILRKSIDSRLESGKILLKSIVRNDDETKTS